MNKKGRRQKKKGKAGQTGKWAHLGCSPDYPLLGAGKGGKGGERISYLSTAQPRLGEGEKGRGHRSERGLPYQLPISKKERGGGGKFILTPSFSARHGTPRKKRREKGKKPKAVD